ncbi:MAG: hypothetical protein IJ660_01910 [Alphaproteobacteria bacterium]|nr:hypothetical protein [Alphaproteobacteria bacterium]
MMKGSTDKLLEIVEHIERLKEQKQNIRYYIIYIVKHWIFKICARY